MTKYNFKELTKSVVIHNDEWFSNGHFAFKKSILTKSQLKELDKTPQDLGRINMILNIVQTTKEFFYSSKEKPQEFTPEYIVVDYSDKSGTTFNIVYSSTIDLALNESYYNFFMNKGCKIFKGSGSINPTLIFKDDEFIGILLPISVHTSTVLDSKIDYEEYNEQLKQEQQTQDEFNNFINSFNKKCLYISNNKAVVRNKPVKSVANITGIENYRNIYVDLAPDKQDYVGIYIDLGVIYMALNTSMKLEYLKASELSIDEKLRLDDYSKITLEGYKHSINEALTTSKWINIAEVKLMELAGESKEYIEKLMQHREYIKELREKESKERELKNEREEQEYVTNQNKIAKDIITQAEQAILKGENVTNKDITLYKSNYECNTTRLILYLMKLHDIKVPLKTQGWINKALFSIYKNEDQDYYTYNYYNSSRDSAVFTKYLNQLVEKIKTKYKDVA